jgi:hypothetical protein
MKQVKKFPLAIEPRQVIKMPYGARVLDVTSIGDQAALWVLCDPDSSSVDRIFHIFGPEKEVDRLINETHYVGSFEYRAEVGVSRLHVFERT